jgi:hypothetical protein
MALKNVLLAALALFALLVGARRNLLAWGTESHAYIVDAALSVLPLQDDVTLRLGQNTPLLRTLVQMGDWNDCLVETRQQWTVTGIDYPSLNSVFYANDYLLFPESPRLHDHGLPDVSATYVPFFDRSLQALRTESPLNAARWIGALLHYVTDSGSPPHAAGIRGEAHIKMETWLDASQIDMNGYSPRLLGKSDAEARSAYVSRMQALVAYSRLRAERLQPLIDKSDRSACEPIELESATETAKVVADLLHTLFVLSEHQTELERLTADITAPQIPGFDALPAKLMFLGSSFSTLSETVSLRPGGIYHGRFIMHDLPAGSYRAAVSRPGSQTLELDRIILRPNQPLQLHWQLKAQRVPNLIQNSDFSLRWVENNFPDYWRFDTRQNVWISGNVKAIIGKTYQLAVDADAAQSQQISLQWMATHWLPIGAPVHPDLISDGALRKTFLTAPENTHYLRVLISGAADPETRIHSVFVSEQN